MASVDEEIGTAYCPYCDEQHVVYQSHLDDCELFCDYCGHWFRLEEWERSTKNAHAHAHTIRSH